MAKMPADSVDAIVTDPPYGIGFMGKTWDGKAISEAARTDAARRQSLGPHSSSRPGRKTPRSSSAFGNSSGQAGAYDFTLTGNQAFQAWTETWAREAFRVLKPGGHLLAFGGTRTAHRLVCAIEDAGFEIRDSVHWVYGSGFPKSLDVSKQTEAAQQWQGWGTALKPAHEPICVARKPLSEKNVAQNVLKHGTGAINVDAARVRTSSTDNIHAKNPHTDGGFGHADASVYGSSNGAPAYDSTSGRWPPNLLLSHHELCKPTGEVRRVKGITGGKNPVRGSGVHAEAKGHQTPGRAQTYHDYADPDGTEPQKVWECVEGCPVRLLDEQSGTLKSGVLRAGQEVAPEAVDIFGSRKPYAKQQDYGGDQGGASRFFPHFEAEAPFRYQAKTSVRERNAGLEGMTGKPHHSTQRTEVLVCKCGNKTLVASSWPTCPRCGADMREGSREERVGLIAANNHPTVKPIALMRWLVRLVCPPNGTVLDPFMGSGSTGCAAGQEGFDFIGIEMSEEYAEIARRRIAYWAQRTPIVNTEVAEVADPTDPTFTGRLF